MITPFRVEELFEINMEATAKVEDGVIIIDNFYKNYEEIHEYLTNIHITPWKRKSDDSRNWIDYYDSRFTIQNGFSHEKWWNQLGFIHKLISKVYDDNRIMDVVNTDLTFNIFQNVKKDISNRYQHYPHIDTAYNVVIYLDKIASGGTVFYDMEEPDNMEEFNLLFDTNTTKIRKIVEAKPNRCIIFNGQQVHGGYIEDHNAYTDNNWRINQVMFYEEAKQS